MKRHVSRVLAIIICLAICMPAYAATGLMAHSTNNTAQINAAGKLYLRGITEPINAHFATAIVELNAQRCIYLSSDAERQGMRLVELDLSSLKESVLKEDVLDACSWNGSVYFIPYADRTRLMAINYGGGSEAMVAETSEKLRWIYAAAQGIVVAHEGGSASMLYVPKEGTFVPYDLFAPVPLQDRGEQVRDMQLRLMALGYMADGADGVFGPKTEAGLRQFQRALGVLETGSADRALLERLYANDAPYCLNYIELETGDSGWCVREMNERLHELFYLDSASNNDRFTQRTASAIKRFEHQLGMERTGIASPELQEMLFDEDTKEYEGYITLMRGDENARVSNLQQRLKKLGYFSGNATGYYGSITMSAVSEFQRVAGLKRTGVADQDMQALLYSKNAPYYVAPPAKISEPKLLLQPTYFLDGECCVPRDKEVLMRWTADGDVEYYKVKLSDSAGAVLFEEERTSVDEHDLDTSMLRDGQTYILEVSAIPKNGSEKDAKSAKLDFKRLPEVNELSVNFEDVKDVLEDVHFLMPGDVKFSWSLDSLASGFIVSITDLYTMEEVCNAQLDGDATDFTWDGMEPAVTYSLELTAIPVDGDVLSAVQSTCLFQKYEETKPKVKSLYMTEDCASWNASTGFYELASGTGNVFGWEIQGEYERATFSLSKTDNWDAPEYDLDAATGTMSIDQVLDSGVEYTLTIIVTLKDGTDTSAKWIRLMLAPLTSSFQSASENGDTDLDAEQEIAEDGIKQSIDTEHEDTMNSAVLEEEPETASAPEQGDHEQTAPESTLETDAVLDETTSSEQGTDQ